MTTGALWRWTQDGSVTQEPLGRGPPDRTAELEEAAVGLADQLATGKTDTVVPPGLGVAFAQLGKALVEARANERVVAIMGETDGEVGQLFNDMAMAIHDPVSNSGLRSTVLSNGATALNGSDPGTPQSRWVAAIDGNASDAAKRE